VCDLVPRNYDASLHPLQAPREYVRALNSVKLERVFAKPFLGSLDGHKDGISCLGKHPRHLSVMLSGACDGEVYRAGHVIDVILLSSSLPLLSFVITAGIFFDFGLYCVHNIIQVRG